MFKNKTIKEKECAIDNDLYWIMRVTKSGNILPPDKDGPVAYYLKDIPEAIKEFQTQYPRRKFIVTRQCFIPVTEDEILEEKKRQEQLKKQKQKARESLNRKKAEIADSIKNKLNPEELKFVKIK